MKNITPTEIFSILVLGLAFVAMLAVITVDLIAFPGRMIPTIVTTILGAVIGYAIHNLGGASFSGIFGNDSTTTKPTEPPK